MGNIDANGLRGRVEPLRWDWEESQDPPAEVDVEAIDFIVAADVVYVGTAEAELAISLANLCRRAGKSGHGLKAFLLLADRPPGGLEYLAPRQTSGDTMAELAESTTAVDRFLTAC